MAFPVVEDVTENSTNTAGTNHTINHPATRPAGQLWILILDKGSTAATVNAHATWTELLDENLANGLYIAYRWTDGTEGASTTLVTSASTRTASHLYRISGAENPATQAPEIGTTASGSSATPDPPLSAAISAQKDYLFIAFYGAAGEEADDDTWSDTPPTSYSPSPPHQKACGIAGTNLGGLIASAWRQRNMATAENPGTFAKDVSAAWRAQTITVHPSASVAHERSVDDTLSLADAVALEVQAVIADSTTATDAAPTIETGKEANVNDSVTPSDALALEVQITQADTLALADAVSAGLEIPLADALAIVDSAVAGLVFEVTINDTLGGGGGPPGPTVAPALIWVDGRLALKIGGRIYTRV